MTLYWSSEGRASLNAAITFTACTLAFVVPYMTDMGYRMASVEVVVLGLSAIMIAIAMGWIV